MFPKLKLPFIRGGMFLSCFTALFIMIPKSFINFDSYRIGSNLSIGFKQKLL